MKLRTGSAREQRFLSLSDFLSCLYVPRASMKMGIIMNIPGERVIVAIEAEMPV